MNLKLTDILQTHNNFPALGGSTGYYKNLQNLKISNNILRKAAQLVQDLETIDSRTKKIQSEIKQDITLNIDEKDSIMRSILSILKDKGTTDIKT